MAISFGLNFVPYGLNYISVACFPGSDGVQLFFQTGGKAGIEKPWVLLYQEVTCFTPPSGGQEQPGSIPTYILTMQ